VQCIPVVGSPAGLVRLGFVGLHRVINNDDVCAPTGEGTTDGNDEASTAFGGHAFDLRVLGKPHVRKECPIPIARDHGAELTSEGRAELMRV